MSFSLTWLPPILQTAGLKVAVVPGWEIRGRAEMGAVLGILCHHTAGSATGNMPSLRTLIDGRPDLPGPLSQLGLGRDGTFYVVAAGRCNHAGAGSWQGVTQGNTHFIGIEAENTGLPGDTPWPEIQLDAYRRGVAAILRHVGRTPLFCAGHKEYALPRGRKDDPDFDMDAFRQSVADIMDGSIVTPAPIPSIEPAPAPGIQTPRTTRRRGDRGELVLFIQRKCGIRPDGVFDADVETAVRDFQRRRGLVPDGIVGPKTWLALDAA